MSDEKDFITDAELAETLRISIRTLRKYALPGEEKGEDIRKIKHFNVGGSRRWSRKSMEEVYCS